MDMQTKRDWVGRQVADGRYDVLERLEKGSMGHVYRAYDHRLQTDVALKFPAPMDVTLEGPEFIERFGREIRSLVRLSHPHIVKIIDVGLEEGSPYVVMQYLAGGSLKARLESGPSREPVAMPLSSLGGWLMDVAKALDFVHDQNYVHRDVKPGNILFDRHGNAFLGDFGLIKALAAGTMAQQSGSLTSAGILVGTPNYIAPELVMGHDYDGRVDQYSLAMTVHEILAGRVFLEGPTPSATMVNQTKVPPPPLIDLVPGVPRRLSDAVLRGLSKAARDRFETCVAFARDVLADIPGISTGSGSMLGQGQSVRGEMGRAPCPACRALLPVQPIHANRRARCARCRGVSHIQVLDDGAVLLTLVSRPKSLPSSPSLAARSMSAATVTRPRPEGPPAGPPAAPRPALVGGDGWGKPPPTPEAKRGRSFASRRLLMIEATAALTLLLVPLLVTGAFGRGGADRDRDSPGASGGAGPMRVVLPTCEPVEVSIAYGTEKQKWLEGALKEFERTPAGRCVNIKLKGMGSVEGAQAVLDGPGPDPIQVWSPASSAYRDVFEKEWELKHGGRPILRTENLALTPMVFVMWKSRHDAFVKKYPKVGFRAMADAIQEPGGWASIGGKPEWGLFKFGHTHPNKSNSGMLSLVLMAYEFADKDHGLTLTDISKAEFQSWLKAFERGVARPAGSLSHSTGTLMKEMVLRGPSQYDCLVLYENLAIEYLKAARDHWGELAVSYPEPNMWNEHPYYILDVPWSSPAQRKAATDFLDFLMSEPIQRRALDHGFRPGNPAVPVVFPDSPLVTNARYGLKVEVPRMCEPPRADVLIDLLASFRRIEP